MVHLVSILTPNSLNFTKTPFFLRNMLLFIKNYPFFIKNYPWPPYKKFQPLISAFIKNSIFGINRDPCSLLHLFASHHSSDGNSDGYAIVYDTCTQVSMATARRCLWHLHANTLWSGWCYYNFDTFGYIWLWFIDKFTSWYILSRQFRNFQDNI